MADHRHDNERIDIMPEALGDDQLRQPLGIEQRIMAPDLQGDESLGS